MPKSVLSMSALFLKFFTLFLISISLVACDSNKSNPPSTDNSIPVANAGDDQIATVGKIVKLDASQSFDEDGDVLIFQWHILDQPEGSIAVIQDGNNSISTLAPDRSGNYLIQLIVNDGIIDSVADQILIKVKAINNIPTANAGENQTSFVGDLVQLDGSKSSDVDGDSLSFSWEIIEAPDNSNAVLINPETFDSTFRPDQSGKYIVQLTVKDGGEISEPVEVIILVTGSGTGTGGDVVKNVNPLANAGLPQEVEKNTTVYLNGSASSDADGDVLTYEWLIVEKPENSEAAIINKNNIEAQFFADINGNYLIRLSVNDGKSTDVVTVTIIVGNELQTTNRKPIANAGKDQKSEVIDLITLDGSASKDEDGDVLSFQWSLTVKPENSQVVITNSDADISSFLPDLPGEYIAQLIVNDGKLSSDPDTVKITIDKPIGNNPPTVDAGDDQSLIEGNSVTLKAIASDSDGRIVSQQWATDGKIVGSTLEIQTETLATGEYVYTITVTDNEGASSSDSITLTVDKTSNAAPKTNNQSLILQEDGSKEILLTANDNESGKLTFFVVKQPENGKLIGTLPNILYTPNANFFGSDSFTFVANDGNSDSDIGNISIIVNAVNDLPSVEAGADQTIVEGNIVQLNATSSDSDGQIVNQRWEELGQNLGNSLSLGLTSLSVGEHVLSVTVTDNDGGSSTDSLKVTVEAKPNVAPEAISSNLAVNEDSLLTLTLDGSDEDSDPLTFTVTSGPDNGVLLGLAPNLTYRPNSNYFGTDSLSFSVNDGEITSNTASISITIDPVNDLPTVNAGKDQMVLPLSTVEISAESSDVEGGITSYEWTKNNVVVSQNKGFVLTNIAVGEHIYTVKVTDSDGLTAQDSLTVLVEENTTLVGSLTGKVVDETGTMIVNARIQLPTGESAISDVQGNYLIDAIKPIERTAVTAIRSGFLKNSDIIRIEAGMQTQQDIVMSRPKKVVEYKPNEMTMIETEGLTVEVPPNVEFMMESGKPFEGEVTLNASYFPITTSEGVNEFPGDTMAINDEGEMGDLTSFGIIKLEASDDMGNPVEVGSGTQIQVSIPADDALEKPPTIPFWYWDENKGMWVEDGVATYDPQTDTYQTTVDGVATFNLDSYAGNVIGQVEVCIADSSGNRLPGYVTLDPADSDVWRNSSKTSVDGQVRISGIVAENDFNLYATTNDGRIGSYANNPVYLNGGPNQLNDCIIIDDNVRAPSINITGTVVDSSGNSKPNIELMVFGEAGGQSFGNPSLIQIFKAKSDANGVFNIDINTGSYSALEIATIGDKRIIIEAAEDDTKSSKELTLTNLQETFDVGNIVLQSNIPPFANAGLDASVYLGDPVRLSAEKSFDKDGSITAYEWRENGVVIGQSSIISTSDLSLGEHIVVLTVTDNFGMKSSDEVKISIVNKNQILYANAGNDELVHLNQNVYFIGKKSLSVGSPISSYEWSENGIVLSTLRDFTYKITKTGVHFIQLKVTNSDGLEDTDEVVITAYEPFEFIKAPLDRTVYLGDETEIQPEGNYNSGLDLKFVWTEDDQVLSELDFVTPNLYLANDIPGFKFTPTEVGVRTFKLTITDQLGNQKFDTVNITVIQKPSNDSSADAGLDINIYLNQRPFIIGNGKSNVSTPKSYKWFENDTLISTLKNFRYTGSNLGVNTLKLEVTFNDDTIATDEITVTVVEDNRNNFLVSAGPDKIYYEDNNVAIYPKAFPDKADLQYEWLLNDEVIYESKRFSASSLPRPTPFVKTPSQQTLTLRVTNGAGVVATDDVVVTIIPEPEKPDDGWMDLGVPRTFIKGLNGIGFNSGGFAFSFPIIEGCEFECFNIGPIGGPQGEPQPGTLGFLRKYEWKINGVTLTEPRFTRSYLDDYDFAEAGIYTVELTISNDSGLSFSDTVEVTVLDESQELTAFANAGIDKDIYLGQSIDLNSLGSYVNSNGSSYLWKDGDTVISNNPDYTYTPTTLGEHVISLTISGYNDLDINISDTDQITVNVFDRDAVLPTAFAGLDQSFYDGFSFESSNNVPSIGVIDGIGTGFDISYQWSKDGEVLSDKARLLTEILPLGVNNLTFTVTDRNGVQATDNIAVTIVESDKTVFVNAGSDFVVETNKKAGLSASIASYSSATYYSLTYEWTIADQTLTDHEARNYIFTEPGTYNFTVKGTDPAGNSGTDDVTVTVIEPQIESQIEIFADAGVDRTIYQGQGVRLTTNSTYTLASCGWSSFEWSIGDSVLYSSEANGIYTFGGTELGEFLLTLTATDCEGSVDSDDVLITVIDNGLVDITPPVVTINGDPEITITVGDDYVDQGATAVDDFDGVITGSIIYRQSFLTTFNPGKFGITYRSTDVSGNTTQANRIVNIIPSAEPDLLAPVIVINGSNPISIPQGVRYTDQRAVATDDRDGLISYSFDSTVNIDVPGSYTVTYTATDSADNTTVSSRVVNVIANPNIDKVKPVITIVGDTLLTILQGTEYIDEGATASDNFDGNITSNISVQSNVEDSVGQYFTTYSVTDSAGNESLATRTIIVEKVDLPDVLPEILVQSLEWIEAQTIEDGSYTNSANIALPIQSTSEVLRAYNRVGEVLASGITPALTYLNSDDSNKVEFLSRKIIAGIEAGNDVSMMVLDLLELQNIDRGFGDQGNYHSSVIDSAFALKALGISGYSDTVMIGRIISYLRTQQSFNDGGFSHSSKNQSSVYETSLALIALQNYQDVLDLKSMIDSANEYLMTNQLAVGGWDTHWETAYALIAITPTSDNFAAYQLAADRLKVGQLANGSWDNDVYTTALAIRALYKSENLDTP